MLIYHTFLVQNFFPLINPENLSHENLLHLWFYLSCKVSCTLNIELIVELWLNSQHWLSSSWIDCKSSPIAANSWVGGQLPSPSLKFCILHINLELVMYSWPLGFAKDWSFLWWLVKRNLWLLRCFECPVGTREYDL